MKEIEKLELLMSLISLKNGLETLIISRTIDISKRYKIKKVVVTILIKEKIISKNSKTGLYEWKSIKPNLKMTEEVLKKKKEYQKITKQKSLERKKLLERTDDEKITLERTDLIDKRPNPVVITVPNTSIEVDNNSNDKSLWKRFISLFK